MKYSPFRILISLTFVTAFFNFNSLNGQCSSPLAALGADTLICSDGALLLDAGVNDTYLWNTGDTTRYLSVTIPGKYWVDVFNTCAEKASDTINISPAPDFNLSFNLPVKEYYCKGETVNLEAVVDKPEAVITYSWSVTTLNTSAVDIDTTRTVTLTATDQYGCQKFKSKALEFQYPYENDSILLVTYDNTEDKFVIIYRKTLGKRTKSYILFNGLSVSDSLTTAGFGNLNQVIDQKTDPHLQSKYYTLQAMDSCGNRSKFSIDKVHRTLYLQVVRETDGTTTLSWNRYIGFKYEYFYILKGSGPDNMVVVDSIRDNRLLDLFSWNDATKPSDIFYYQVIVNTPVKIVLETVKKAEAGPYVHSLSNLEDNRLESSGINNAFSYNNSIQVFPNPYKGSTLIQYELYKDSDISLKVYNMLGQNIAEIEHGRKSAGKYETRFSAREFGSRPGIYYLKFEIDGRIFSTRKLIEN